MELHTRHIKDNLLVEISGAVDLWSAGDLFDALVGYIDAGNRKLVVDLSKVSHLTRAGARGLVVAAKLMQGSRGRLRICGADKSAAELLRGLPSAHLLDIDPNPEPALAVLSCNQVGDIAVSQAECLSGRAAQTGARTDGTSARADENDVPTENFARFIQIHSGDDPASAVNGRSMGDIAISSGFADTQDMRRSFQRHLGITPEFLARQLPAGRRRA